MLDLRWLLLSLALLMGLHIAYIASWVSALVGVFFAWRYLIERNGWQLPKLWLLMPITLVAALGILVNYSSLFGRDASVALLTVMLSLKLMEARAPRDYILLILGGYFLTITTFLFTQSIVTALFMLLPVVCLTATLVGISHPNGDLHWRFQATLAGKLLGQAAPLMVLLFFLFPRIPGPLWGVPQDAYKGMTGLSDSMSPGNISQLTQSGATAFRVQFQGAVPPNNALYWRGPVLWNYDGSRWTMPRDFGLPRESVSVSGSPVVYSVTLEPHNQRWLLMLDIPTMLPTNSDISPDRQVLAREPVRVRMRYQGRSNLNYILAANLTERERRMALRIPAMGNPHTRALAGQWHNQPPETILQNALNLYREKGFVYTLSPPVLSTDNPMDDFLFNTRRGFCEHFAGSFVYLMRAAGVPARVVTGYQGGEVNPVGHYLIVRQSDAHAWAEVWLQSRGWVRVDPTAAVSPSRVESGIESALPDGDLLPILARKEHPLLRKLYLNWDAVNNGWNQFVLGYDQQRQLDFLSRLAGSEVSWQDMVIAMMVSVSLVGLIISYLLLKTRLVKMDPLQRLYAIFLRKLARVGLKRYSHEGPLDFSKRAARRLPAKTQDIQVITELYIRLRYANSQARDDKNPVLMQFKHRISAFDIQ